LLLSVVVWLASPLQAAAEPGLSADSQQWSFRVLLDGREIGFHDFQVSRQGHEQRVEIDARFDVKFLFINAYRYRHQNIETWRNGCLVSIASTTDDNGEMLQVNGTPGAAGFEIVDPVRDRVIDSDCVRSFAYWDLDLLSADRLLNAQTGEFVDVRVEHRGAGTLKVGGLDVPAQRYAVVMPEGTIDLWYGRDSGQWLALESRTEGGRLLRYEPVLLPLPLDGGARLAMK